jgi:hypothetical protein
MDKGVLYSGIGHIGLILWVFIGGFFIRHDDAPEIAVTEVSMMTSAEFEAMLAAAPTAPAPEAAQTDIATPTPPTPIEEPPAPVEEVVPPQPDPEPAKAPEPEASPDVTDVAPTPVPQAPDEPAPPAPVAIEEPPVLAPNVSERPRPKPAQRVAPVPTEAPAPDAVTDAAPTPAVTPEAAPEAVVVEEAKPEAAPEEAGTELATEANKAEPLAPSASSRPKPKPARRTEAPVSDNPAPPETTDATQAAIDAAIAAAAGAASGAEATPAPATAPSGPPMTAGEKDGLRVAVQACWNVGSLSSEALLVTVTVGAELGQDGKPDATSIKMLSFEGGSEGAARQAYEAARRAIIRCGANGFKLPAEKYDQWRSLELVFNPERMRIK